MPTSGEQVAFINHLVFINPPLESLLKPSPQNKSGKEGFYKKTRGKEGGRFIYNSSRNSKDRYRRQKSKARVAKGTVLGMGI